MASQSSQEANIYYWVPDEKNVYIPALLLNPPPSSQSTSSSSSNSSSSSITYVACPLKSMKPKSTSSQSSTSVKYYIHPTKKNCEYEIITLPSSSLGPRIPILQNLSIIRNDMVKCDDISAATILHCVRHRFRDSQIYTNIGVSPIPPPSPLVPRTGERPIDQL